ncbi:MAG TPA: Uma2 family endonuclease [Pirellulales bacterium]|jgi:Uma2 family endonuclease|nr:Uma2 family endonuclease [Pirellulales bacterium]
MSMIPAISILPPVSTTSTRIREIEYPSGDGRPVAETPVHRDNLLFTIETLERWFAGDPLVYVSGNMLMYYVPGNKRRHVAPDVFVTRGIAKEKPRKSYFVWEDGHGPDLVIEFTSRSTRKEDTRTKFVLYRDTLRVSEYFMFDPYGHYLQPPLQGHRLQAGEYVPIRMRSGRLPSNVLGLELEANGLELRLYDSATGGWLLTSPEASAEAFERYAQALASSASPDAERAHDEARRARSVAERRKLMLQLEWAQVENERLRRELDQLRRRKS